MVSVTLWLNYEKEWGTAWQFKNYLKPQADKFMLFTLSKIDFRHILSSFSNSYKRRSVVSPPNQHFFFFKNILYSRILDTKGVCPHKKFIVGPAGWHLQAQEKSFTRVWSSVNHINRSMSCTVSQSSRELLKVTCVIAKGSCKNN